jgi:multicomponent Na+:H+ antiporter subunit D
MTVLSLALLVPWVAGAALLAADGRRTSIAWLAVVVLVATLVVDAVLAAEVLANGPIVVTTGNWPVGVGITLRADALGVPFALVSIATLTAAVVHEALDGVTPREFPALVVLLAAGLSGAFLTGDLFNFYVFFELALAASYVLAIHGRSPRVLGAGLVFTAVNLLGTFVFIISVASVYRATGTLDLSHIAARMAHAYPNAAILIAVGFFVAFSVKLGLFPFHFWLPTVYTAARPAVAAILSGSLANIGAYGLLRFGAGLLPRELQLAAGALIVIGAASIVYGGVLAVSRRTASEMLAYSAIGQVGYVLVAIGVGGPIGFGAAILYSIVNAVNKTMLFLTTRQRGLFVGGAFAIGALSIAGIPPAVGFVGKLEIFRAGIGDPAVIAILVLGSLLSIAYAFQIYQFERWRPDSGGPAALPPTRRRSRIVPVVLAVGILALGLWPEPLLALTDAAARVLVGTAR